jgi:ribosomal protein L22
MKIAKAKSQPRISLKHAIVIAREIRNKPLNKALKFLEDLVDKKIKLPNGKYYTKAAEEILSLLKDAKANAEAKALNTEKLFIKEFKTNKAFKFITPKSRWRFRRRQKKICRIEVTLEER